uniref:Uncharacterized protein n=1 Tax=Candidatus Methanophagaceae archaeon ANME-1 ERB6 TaxID=2759912 RepID=A0A7G9YRZ1_9EURY|nr:hypothetical protein HMJGLFMP_00017 [Methanosarcinales archaeon ANME-1 ERB6]
MFLPKVKKSHATKGNFASTASNFVNIFKPDADVVQVDHEPWELTLLGFP